MAEGKGQSDDGTLVGGGKIFHGNKGAGRGNITNTQWVEHFAKLLRSEEHGEAEETWERKEVWEVGEAKGASVEPRLDAEIGMQELVKALRGIRNKEVPGEDRITAEFIKGFPIERLKEVRKMLNVIWKSGEMVIKETGFLENLFTEEELNSDIRDKEAKVAYLTKLINVVSSELAVRPTKIIAGQEPTKTNELLQAIGKALDKKINSAEVVQHFKANLEKDSPQCTSDKHESLTMTPVRRNGQMKEVTQEYEKVVDPIKKLSQHERKLKKKIVDQHNIKSTKDTGSMRKTHQTQTTKKNDETMKHLKGPALVFNDKIQNPKGSTDNCQLLSGTQNDDVYLQIAHPLHSPLLTEEQCLPFGEQNIGTGDFPADISSVVVKDNKVPESSEGNRGNWEGTVTLHAETRLQESANAITQPSVSDESVSMSKDCVRPINSRPSSARPAAPKLRWKTDFNVKSSELALLKNDSVIVENFDALDDGTDSMVVLETEASEYPTMSDMSDEGTQEHGYLVAQILETQRELANVTTMDPISNKVDTEMEQISKKSTENIMKEVEKLRSTIQTLTRTTHPMGKLLDFLQEDVESMQIELFEWRNQFALRHNQLQVQKVEFHTTTHPLEEAFNEIQAGIEDQLDKIHQTKLNIVKNNHKIEQLLAGRA